jgi:hypothetical protein
MIAQSSNICFSSFAIFITCLKTPPGGSPVFCEPPERKGVLNKQQSIVVATTAYQHQR